ncbi:MAG: helix-hairpin-helix domain-containing protein [Planctomycetes bacterium]|nr:helix-hairpin-helix domain-containing protein [Planctomycetota bacterium]
MRRQRWLLVAWVLLVMGLAVRAFATALIVDGGVPPLVVSPLRLDVNTASVVELQLLPGIGRVRAEAIVLERLRRGPFTSLEDLGRIDGLGPLTVGGLAPYLRCSSPEDRAGAGR